MARRGERYKIRSGSVETEVNKETFDVLRESGWAYVSPTNERRAVLKAGYRLRIDHQTNRFQIDVAEPGAPDPHAIKSIFYLIFARAIYAGTANSVLFAYHDQVHQGCRLPTPAPAASAA